MAGRGIVARSVVPSGVIAAASAPKRPSHRKRRAPALHVLLTLAAVLSAFLAVPTPAFAADANTVPVASVTLKRLDGAVVKTTIIAAFATSHDTVEVYNYAPVQASNDWRRATSMDNAVWLFKPNGGPPKLAIFFSVEAGMHIARVYDDQFAEGSVPVAVRSNRVVLSHPMHWTLKAETAQPWLGPGDQPADDLQIDGAFSLPNESDAHTLLAHRWRGQDAWSFHLADPHGTGIPTYSLLRLNSQAPLSAAVPRAQLDVNVAHYHLQPFRPAIFWPYLGSADVSVRSWFDRRPPLAMNWATGQLQDFGSIIPDLEPEDGMQIFSVVPVVDHQVNELDFENPFAYYRFDSGHTGYPNLIIRHAYYPAGDQYLQASRSPSPVEFVRYSWGDGNGLMQYKLGLLGRHSAPTTLHIGGMAIQSLAYRSLPDWVLARRWDFVTFVASETGGYRSSEGIYAWDYAPGDYSWLFGESASLPLTAYHTIAAGLRGEYRVLPDGPPTLYVSPVDGRLHLLGAQSGTWTLDDHQTITTASLDGQTVGRWVRTVDNVAQEVVYAVPGALLYAGAGQVIVLPVTSAATVAVSPPKDGPTLGAVRSALPTQPPNVAESGLRPLLNDKGANGRAGVTITHASLDHVRLIPGGWRGELTLTPGAALLPAQPTPPAFAQALAAALGCPAEAAALSCAGSAGHASFVVAQTDGWHITPASPAALRVLSIQASPALSGVAATPITIDLANRGQADATGRRLRVWVQRSGAAPVDLASFAVDVPAGERRQVTLHWLPTAPGHWTIGATLATPGPAAAATGDAGSRSNTSSTTSSTIATAVTIQAGASPAWWLLGPSSSGWSAAGALGALLAAGLLAAATAWVVLR